MELKDFKKNKDFLICVDSDGCAMDTMDIKHIRCFGPCMVDEWGLDADREAILKRWNEINLYTMTRGINRFKGLALALREINDGGTPVDDLASLEKWVNESDELSNGALEKAADETGSTCLKKALSWSIAVNESINALPFSQKKPFDGAADGLEFAHRFADIAIVSSANLDAVVEEWDLYGLSDHVDIILAQNVGSKAFCISELLKKGYSRGHVMMTGDAPGDRDAAKKNGVFYFPIMVKHETDSWREFKETAVLKLVNGEYGGDYQNEKITAFEKNLGA